jgi:hypothetical protein
MEPSDPQELNLSHMSLVQELAPYFFKLSLNITLPSMLKYSKQSLPFRSVTLFRVQYWLLCTDPEEGPGKRPTYLCIPTFLASL